MDNLEKLSLPQDKRVTVYAVGFAYGILLDKANPGWRKKYLTEKFFIEKYLPGNQ
jgi:hypothetical protein